MKFSRVTAALVMASLSAPAFAGAEQAVGKLTSASQGTFVSREGKLVPAYAGQALFAGDRIVTRDRANAKVAFQGCSYAMKPTSILSVGKSACSSSPKSLVAKSAGFSAQDDATTDGSDGDSHTGTIVGGLALVAIGLGIYAALDNHDTTPASP